MRVEPIELSAGAQAGGETEEAVFRRQQAFAPTLRTTSAAQRLAKLDRLGRSLRARRAEIQQASAADFSKPPDEVELGEIFPVLHEIAQAKRYLKRWMKPKRVASTLAMFGTKAEIRFVPRGVCLILSPWNYPFNLSFGPLVSAIAAGNTVMLKPSELTPNSSRLIARIVAELFAPDEVAVFEGGADVATRLLALPFNHIFFTGSPAVGRIVMKAAAEQLASVTLELGGKSPAIVDESADLDRTVRNLVGTKFMNQGQTCIAPDYVYVHERVRDAFLDRLKARVEAVFGVDEQAQRANPDFARSVNDRHFHRVKGLLDDALARGARIVAGGATRADERFIAPTVLADVAPGSRILDEEIFGPLLPVIGYADLDAILREIDMGPTPLALYVFGEDREKIEKTLSGAAAGGSCVNHSVVHFLHGNLPFGGLNESGIGSAHGIYGFRAFSHERPVLVDRFSVSHWLFPPYTARVKALVRMTSRFFT